MRCFAITLLWLLLPGLAAGQAPLDIDVSAIPSRFPILQDFSWEIRPKGGTPPYQLSLAGEYPTDAALNGTRFEGNFQRTRTAEIEFWVMDAKGQVAIVARTIDVYSMVPMSPPTLQFNGLKPGGANEQRLLINSIPSGQLVGLAETGGFVTLSKILVITPAVVTTNLIANTGSPHVAHADSGFIAGVALSGLGLVPTFWGYLPPPNPSFGKSPVTATPLEQPAIADSSLVASPAHIEFVSAPEADVLSKEVTVQAMRQGVTYATAVDQSWLKVSEPEGQFPDAGRAGGTVKVTVTADPAGLAEGRHDGTVRFYDQSGIAIASTVVQLRILKGKLPLTVDTKSAHFDAAGARRTIRIRNPNDKPVHFDLRIDEEFFQSSVSEGEVPARDEVAVTVLAGPEQTSDWRHANLVIAFDDTELDLIRLSLAPATTSCEAAPAHVFFESPGEHTAVYRGGIVDIRAVVRDGCGRTPLTGSLFLLDSMRVPVFLNRGPDNTWTGSWKVGEEATGNHRLDAFWVDASSGKQAASWLQVVVRP